MGVVLYSGCGPVLTVLCACFIEQTRNLNLDQVCGCTCTGVRGVSLTT